MTPSNKGLVLSESHPNHKILNLSLTSQKFAAPSLEFCSGERELTFPTSQCAVLHIFTEKDMEAPWSQLHLKTQYLWYFAYCRENNRTTFVELNYAYLTEFEI